MNVMVLCEYSGMVRDAFRALGHDAVSCDLLPTEIEGPHIQGDCRELDYTGLDLVIAHPPCTHLAVSGAKHFKTKWEKGLQLSALEFVDWILELQVPMIALENPVGIISSFIRKPDQIIQPWQFGHLESKKTCLWLKGLGRLQETQNVYEQMMTLPIAQRNKVHHAPPSPDRWKDRSRTYPGIAWAMASQWGGE